MKTGPCGWGAAREENSGKGGSATAAIGSNIGHNEFGFYSKSSERSSQDTQVL